MQKETVQNAGEKFVFNGKTLTVKSFFGSSGEEYKTASEAEKANPEDKFICVKNEEFGGATDIRESIKKIQVVQL